MTGPLLALSRRLRRTPFTDRVAAAGVKACTVYNHMLLPVVFESPEADYHHLKRSVQIWDVSCQRQVALRGPDAARLAQHLTPRDLSAMQPDQCFYTPMVDDRGGMLNDPVILRPDSEGFWVSIADSDMLLWIRGIATGMGLDCEVSEPEVYPLAVQGPRSDELMARVFGDAVRSIRFFRFKRLRFRDTSMLIARSGFSRQGGFEIYVEDAGFAVPLWDALLDAGRDLDSRAGGPNLIERIEGGLLSYGNDMTRDNTPFECGLGRFCDAHRLEGCIGGDALLRMQREPPARQIRGIHMPGEPVPACTEAWPVNRGGAQVGWITSAAWSPDCSANVALGMIDRSHWDTGTTVDVETPHGTHRGTVTALPFKPPPAAR